MHDPSLGFLAADILYVVLTIAGLVLTLLYYHAYKEMKRTPMIRSVWVLMLAITIDSAFFAVTTISSTFHEPLEDALVTPPWLLVPKIIFLAGLLCFMYATLTPSDTEKHKVHELQKAGDLATIKKEERR